MAIGDTVQAGLLRADFSPIERGGAAKGRAYSAIGESIGGAIEKYQLNKEKREAEERTAMGNLAGFSPEELTEMKSRDPNLSKAIDNIQSDKASPKDFQLINASSAPYIAGRSRRLQEENAQIKNQLSKLNYDTERILQLPKVRDAIAQYGLNNVIRESKEQTIPSDTAVRLKTNESIIKTLPSKTDATISSNKATEMKGDIFVTDVMNRGGVVGVAKEMESDRDLGRENIRSQIESKRITSAAQLYKAMNIGANAPQDLEKRFDDIASQISKVDDSQIKVRNKDGDEVMVSLKDYQSNPDDFAPLVSDRLKALQSKKEALIEEQTSAALGAKIPYTDPETGETKYTTVADKLAYNQARAKKAQGERQAQIEENKAKLPNAFYGIPSSPVIGY